MEIIKQIFEGSVILSLVIYGIIFFSAPIEIFLISRKVDEINKNMKK